MELKIKNIKIFCKSIADIVSFTYLQLVLYLCNLLPGRPGNIIIEPVRIFFLKLISIKIGKKSQVSKGFFVFRAGNFEAGIGCRFGHEFRVWNFHKITIENNLLASHGIKIICGNHKITQNRENIPGPVYIGENVWLGVNVTIVGPCNIGRNVIIGANSYVTGELMPDYIYAGNPAKPIRKII